MNITDLIIELLQQGQKVELPEIGTFESVEQSPRHDPDARIYYPATRNIVFRSITTGDDSVVKEIARRECVSEDVARQMWSNYIDALSEKIKRSGEHRFGACGGGRRARPGGRGNRGRRNPARRFPRGRHPAAGYGGRRKRRLLTKKWNVSSASVCAS